MTDVHTPEIHDNHEDLPTNANEGLVKKNRELIEESRRHRSRAEELQAERDQLHSQLMDIRLNRPVDELLQATVSLPAGVARSIASQYVDFVLDGEEIKIVGKDGKPVILTGPGSVSVRGEETVNVPGEEYEAKFSHQGLHEALHHLSGGALDNILYSMSQAGGGGSAGQKGRGGSQQHNQNNAVKNYANQLGLK